MGRHSLALAVLLSTAGVARADGTVAILGVEHVDVPDALAQQLTDALRQRAAATAGVRTVQGKDLIEIKMVFGCESEALACLAQAGRSLGADKLLFGALKKGPKPNTVVVNLKLLDVKTATIEKLVSETLNKKDLSAGSIGTPAARWFASLVEPDAKLMLTVTSDPVGANVTIDGQPGGRTPITLRDLSPGAHAVTASLPGHKTATRSVELRPGVSQEVAIALDPVGEPVAEKPEPAAARDLITRPAKPPIRKAAHPGRAAKILALAALGGAVAAGGVAIYTWRTYVGLEETAYNDLLRVPQPADPSAAERQFFSQPNCNPPASLASPEITQYKNTCSSGETFVNATTALWVVAGALAGSSVVAYIVGNRQAARAAAQPAGGDDAPPQAPKTTGRIIQQSLRIEPVIGTQGGALQATFEF